MNTLPTGTVTFLFTDIEGSTKLAQQYPDQWEILRARHHAILQSAMDAHHGHVFQIIGDAFCVAFHTASDGINAAVDAQRKLQSEDWENTPIKVRMGLHTGEATIHEHEYHGYLAMSLVQRIMSSGHGGQILLSNAVENLLRGQLPEDISLRDMSEHKFKDVSVPIRVFQVAAPDLRSDFPALRALDVFLNNLPTQLTSFIGREKELGEIKSLLQNTHILTLIGPGGTGKTRLSIRTASEMLGQYSDGVWLVELAPILDPLLVPRTTAIAIGLRFEPQRPVIDMLCDYLHEKKLLIVLDNCEHLVDACAHMANQILQTAPHVHILASSREALGIAGEVSYRVPSLELPDMNHLPPIESLSHYEAVKLFIDRATAAVPSFSVTNENAPALAQICYRLDGIPLAIELAAAKICVLNLEQISNRLDDRFRLLTGGIRTALERHQTLRATIDWSYNLLPAMEQTLFRRLAIFIDGWTLEAAESICSGSAASSALQSDDILDHLEQLIKKSLVMREETTSTSRYRMLETMRQYANEKLVESGESDTLRDKHLKYFLELAETASPHLIRPEQVQWLVQLDADYENLRAALQWVVNMESAEYSLRLCASLGRYWFMRTFWLEGSKWLQSALSKTAQDSNPKEKAARVRALYADAELSDQLDDLHRLKNSAHLSLALAQEVSNPLDIALARFQVASELYRRWDNDNSLLLLEQCLVEFQKLNEHYWEFRTYALLSNVLITQGKLKYSEAVTQGLILARKGGERQNLAQALAGYSEWTYGLNRAAESIRYAEEADELLKQIGSSIEWTSYVYAELARLNGKYQEAEAQLNEIQERYGLIGEKNVRSGIIANLGVLALEQGDLDRAQVYFEEALATAREVDSKTFIASRLAEIGIVDYLRGNLESYRQKVREGILLVKELSIFHKRYILLLLLNFIDFQKPEVSVRILGTLNRSERESERPIDPTNKRYYNHAETQARKELGDVMFESAFDEGCNMSLDEALDLVLKTVEEM